MERKILFCVYHDLSSEERSNEIFKVLNTIGNVKLISYSKGNNKKFKKDRNKIIRNEKGKNYIKFLLKCIVYIFCHTKLDLIMLHDNYTSILIPIIKLLHPNISIFYDSSEYYPLAEINKVFKQGTKEFYKGYILRLAEKKYIKMVDIVIAANNERAMEMMSYYKLKKQPIIFDNSHYIDEKYDIGTCEIKYKTYFEDNRLVFIYAGGIYYDRDTLELVDAFLKNKNIARLIIAGNCDEKYYREFKERISKERGINIHYIGIIKRAELKYLYERAHVGISAFKKITFNNLYCASGKIYECLLLGKPILCSYNPPFIELCEKYGVGIASDDYNSSILEIIKNYKKFENNAIKYAKNYDRNRKYSELKKEIERILK